MQLESGWVNLISAIFTISAVSVEAVFPTSIVAISGPGMSGERVSIADTVDTVARIFCDRSRPRSNGIQGL
jgi:hypothetical protein